MPQTQPSPKPINNNSSRAFANDNFCGINHPPLEGGSNGIAVWGGVNFLNVSPQKISLNKPSSAQKASQAFNLKASSQAFNLKVSSQAFNLKTPSQAFNSKAPSDFNSNASQAFNSKASRAFNQRASLNNPHSFLNPSPAFKHFKISPSLAQNESPQETSLNKPNSAQNASLFLFKQTLEQKQLAPGVASFRLRSFLTPFWLKTSHWLVFLTPEPNHDPQTLFNPIEEQQKQWADNSRGITPAASALIAVAIIVVACVLTACTAAPAAGAAGAGTGAAAGAAAGGTAAAGAGAAGAGAGAAAGTTAAAATTATAATAAGISTATAVGTVVATTAASTFTISAVNASMNAEGDIFKQTKDIGHQTLKDTTSDEALKSYAIAGATALLTMGITTGIDFLANGAANTANAANGVANGAANTANAANGAANSTSSISSLGNTTLSSGLPAAASKATTATNTITTALKNTLIQSVSSSVAESAINGDSFSDAFKESTKNLLINAAGAIAANKIGNLAHGTTTIDANGNLISYTNPTIKTATQLTLHAALGCAMASAGGNDCASGAAAGVAGELTAGFLDRNTNLTNAQIIESSKLIGALAAAGVAGPDDGGSVFAGSQIGRNAGENNELLHPKLQSPDKLKESGELDGAGGNKLLKDTKDQLLNPLADKFVKTDNIFVKAGLFPVIAAGSVAIPETMTEVFLGIFGGSAGKAYGGGLVGKNTIANPIPENFARVIGGSENPTMLGLSNRTDVFVTDAKVLQGLNPSEISKLLKIRPDTSYSITTFSSKNITGIATPINRTDLGFVGGGRTAGGAPEFVIPNGPIPKNSTTTIITK